MQDNKINVLFLTKENCNLAYSLRPKLISMNCEVLYVNSLKELINKILYMKTAIIFLDDQGKEELNILAPLLSTNLLLASNVVYIGNDFDYVQDFTKYPNFFVCTQEQVVVSLPSITSTYRLTTIGNFTVLDKDRLNTVLNYNLTKLGFTQKWLGYKFIKDCLDFCVTNNFTMGSLITDVYPVVAVKNNTTANNVERSIRNAITKAYEETQFNVQGFEELHNTAKKITNRWFLACLLDKLNQMDIINTVA